MIIFHWPCDKNMLRITISCFIFLILFGCQVNNKDINVVKSLTNKPITKQAVKEKKNIFKQTHKDKIIPIDNDIQTYSLNKQDRLGYKVVVNQDVCKIVFSIEYFLQQKSKQNRKLDLQEIKLNIGFYF